MMTFRNVAEQKILLVLKMYEFITNILLIL